MIVHLTKAHLTTAPNPNGEILLADDSVKGFCLRIRPTGHRSYWLRYSDQYGRSKKLKIADGDEMAVGVAREAARQAKAKIVALKHDPAAERAARRSEVTLGGLLGDYITAERANWADNTFRRVRSNQKHIKRLWGDLRLSEITVRVVEEKLQTLRKTPAAATNVRKLAKQAWDWANKHEVTDKRNPFALADNLEPERARDRVLSPDEYRRFFTAIDEYWARNGPSRHSDQIWLALEMLAYTGKRKVQIRKIQKDMIEGAKITITEKMRALGELHMSSHVRALVERARTISDPNSPYLFDLLATESTMIDQVWRKLRERLALVERRPSRDKSGRIVMIEEYANIHDLRRSFNSTGRDFGVDRDILADLMGHKRIDNTRPTVADIHYRRLQDKTLLAAAEKMADVLNSIRRTGANGAQE